MQTQGGRVVWLIDGAYVFKGAQTENYYLDLRRELQQWMDARFYKIIFFNSAKSHKQDKFHDWLYKNGFEVRLYNVKEMTVTCPCCRSTFGREVQAGVDVGICTAILTEKYSRLVLTAGDGDFIDALKFVKKQGKELYISGFKKSLSKRLSEVANEIKFLSI